MKSIPYGRHSISDEDIAEVVRVLKSDNLTQGSEIEKFESEFAKYVDAKYAVAVANGTAALHLSALALGVKKGDKVITTPITFVASANCIRYCNGEIVFADIDPDSYLIDIDKIKEILARDKNNEIKGIIPVDFAGYPVNLEALYALTKEKNLWIIEDACHAPGGYYIDTNELIQKCGNSVFADLSIFSFHPVKHIATGEGGMITTNNVNLYNKLVMLRSHGITKDKTILIENHGGWYYEMHELGYNYRLTDFQAALGLSQLKYADTGLNRRQEIALKYNYAFKNSNIKTPFIEKNIYHAYHLYVIQVEDRIGLYNYLKSNNILTQVHYIPVHLQPYYKKQHWRKGDFIVAENYYEKCLSLPMYPSLTEEQQVFVIDKVLEFIKK